MTTSVESTIESMGLTLPQPARPVASYVPALRTGDLIYCSGQIPVRDGEVVYRGQVGAEGDISEDDAYDAARICALNCLAAIKAVVGDLDAITRIVRINGYVNSAPGFTDQPTVVNGASDLLKQVFGDRGEHTRVAVGVAELPLDAAVEVDMIVEVR